MGSAPPRAVVSWEGPGEPIMLTLYGPDGEVALPLLPKRALTLAQELLTRGVQAIKADSWADMHDQAAPQRVPNLGAAECRLLGDKQTYRQRGPNVAS